MPGFQNDDWFYSEDRKNFETFLSVSKSEILSTIPLDYYSFDSTLDAFEPSFDGLLYDYSDIILSTTLNFMLLILSFLLTYQTKPRNHNDIINTISGNSNTILVNST